MLKNSIDRFYISDLLLKVGPKLDHDGTLVPSGSLLITSEGAKFNICVLYVYVL